MFFIVLAISMVSSIWIPEISASTSFGFFFPRSSGGFGIQYWLQSRFIYPLVWRNTQIGKIFSFFWVLGQFSHHRLSKNRFISLFWPSFCLSTSKNRAKNLKTWKNTSIGVFRHTNHLPTRVLTGYWVPVRLELLGKKTKTCWHPRQQISNEPRRDCYTDCQIWDFPKFL